LRAAGETETTQENIQDWLGLDEGGPAFQLLADEEIAAVIFFLIFHLFLSFRAIFCFINQDYRLIRIRMYY
jgi:uncharacterized membrane protein YagU involved in acid resistance